MDNTPDYKNNLAFAPGDWSDSRVNTNTDRTATTIQLIEKIEELEKENSKIKDKHDALIVGEQFLISEWYKLKQLLKECRDVAEFTKTIVNKHKWFDEVITKIDEVLK